MVPQYQEYLPRTEPAVTPEWADVTQKQKQSFINVIIYRINIVCFLRQGSAFSLFCPYQTYPETITDLSRDAQWPYGAG